MELLRAYCERVFCERMHLFLHKPYKATLVTPQVAVHYLAAGVGGAGEAFLRRKMARLLSSALILEENGESDCLCVSSLRLTHRALSDVSCLVEFSNLSKLDLSGNNLISLEGLRSCANLTWLSVVENKLESLKGVEGLSILRVLNAGRNKLVSVDEVQPLGSLQALILNDNRISSICGLAGLTHLNTIVLSRNPIRDIGESLRKVKSLAKLSLSNCQVQTIGSSLMLCLDLKELRFAHNEITILPAELARNAKIETLDLGDNLIRNWTDIEVLSSLRNLKNLNLLGNPISEDDKLVKKIRKSVPSLQIFNAKPIERQSGNKKSSMHGKDDQRKFTGVETAKEFDGKEPLANKNLALKDVEKRSGGSDLLLGEKKNELASKKNNRKIKKESKAGPEGKKEEQTDVESSKVAGIDDGETPFVDLILSESIGNFQEGGRKRKNMETLKDAKSLSGLTSTSSHKNKMAKATRSGLSGVESLITTSEIGTGGPSMWED